MRLRVLLSSLISQSYHNLLYTIVDGMSIQEYQSIYETKYSRVDQIKIVEDSDIPSILLKAVLDKFYLVHSWIFCPIFSHFMLHENTRKPLVF